MQAKLAPMRYVVIVMALLSTAAHAQWKMQTSGTTASLRGIYSIPAGNNAPSGVAWASGTNGTVLRTEDGGLLWQNCTVPPGAATLDFRGVRAWDANTAIVMSSGPGDQSRLYKTTDGCNSWKLIFTNPDKDGFWDAVNVADQSHIIVLGDPVRGKFIIEKTSDGGKSWSVEHSSASRSDEGAFAASNSSLLVNWADGHAAFGTGGSQGSRLFVDCNPCVNSDDLWVAGDVPMFAKGKTAGIFSLTYRDLRHWVAVGGDYSKPNDRPGTAALTLDAGKTWQTPLTLPNGYRSSVAYDTAGKAFITVGPNGTDISTDDGRNWRALRPQTGDASDADRNWNALSLPFVVGPNGRIGKLEPGALTNLRPTSAPR